LFLLLYALQPLILCQYFVGFALLLRTANRMQFASRTDGFIVSSRAAKIEENNIYSASASGYATVFW
jgi:hypothetical protein